MRTTQALKFVRKYKWWLSMAAILVALYLYAVYTPNDRGTKCEEYTKWLGSGTYQIYNKDYTAILCYIRTNNDAERVRLQVREKGQEELLAERYYSIADASGPNDNFGVVQDGATLYYGHGDSLEHGGYAGQLDFPLTWWDWLRANYLKFDI